MNIFTERRSIRKYDPTFKIPRDELNQILKETMRAPSSQNMQPTRFFIIETDAYKERLRDALYGNQLQLETSSHMICIFTDLHKFDYAEKIFDTAVEKGIMPGEVRDRQLRSINNMKDDFDLDHTLRTGTFDGGLIAMQLMLVAKSHGYATCPIGGFNHEKLADVFDIDKDRYKPLLVVSIGKADEDGWDSVRLENEDVVKFY